jgi:ABC-type transporter Mla MlaB component
MVGIFLNSDLFKRHKSVFALSGDLQMRVILHLLKFCDHQTAVHVTALKMSHFNHIFSQGVKLCCKQYILYSVVVSNLGSVIELNNI